MIKELLQGKPFKHPLHPAIVHYPVALFIFSLLLDLATLLGDDNNALFRGAFYTMALGVGMALVAAIPGLVDWADIRADHPAKKRATAHMALNLTVVGLYVVNLLLRYSGLEQTATPTIPLVLSLIGVGILSVAGYLGGTLVYDDGIGVGRHRRHHDAPEKTIRVSSRDAAGGFVTVARADGLANHETLRVACDGHVMTIVNLDDQFYAFQEFCTHRFGPLSEGHFQDHQVMCPWHGSCFDVRTGKVTQGPAKVDLKTYQVTVQNGQLAIRVPEKTRSLEREDGHRKERELAQVK
jgi:nitrite reductase/ring-hydroxylating ferredoxin subunit/uncharacterized membrane protein